MTKPVTDAEAEDWKQYEDEAGGHMIIRLLADRAVAMGMIEELVSTFDPLADCGCAEQGMELCIACKARALIMAVKREE